MKKNIKIPFLIVGGLLALILLLLIISSVVPLFGPESEEQRLARERREASKDSLQQIADSIRLVQKIEKSIQKGSRGKIEEVRVCSQNWTKIRTGPGQHYRKEGSKQLNKGDEIFVLGDINGWLKFRLTAKDVGWFGWVNKDRTVPKKQWNLSKYDVQIKKWMRSGVIVKVNPEINEALVNSSLWDPLDRETKENIGSVLAKYCAYQQSSDALRCDIKDVYSGKKLATYCKNRGFRVF